jgi:hypothetical protein
MKLIVGTVFIWIGPVDKISPEHKPVTSQKYQSTISPATSSFKSDCSTPTIVIIGEDVPNIRALSDKASSCW